MQYISRSIQNVKREVSELSQEDFNEEKIKKVVQKYYRTYDFYDSEEEIIKALKEINEDEGVYTDEQIEEITGYYTDGGSFTVRCNEDGMLKASVKIEEFALDHGVDEESYMFIVHVNVD